MFTLTVLQKLLLEDRSVFSPAHQSIGNERVRVSIENKKSNQILLKLLEKWFTYKLRKFWMVFDFFDFV